LPMIAGRDATSGKARRSELRDPSEDESLPLAGVEVVEFGQYIAGPGAAQLLADLGAAVTKVEPPDGDPVRSVGIYGTAMLRTYNRKKRSIVLDLKTRQGREVASRLVSVADVVVHNMRPGNMERFGLGAADVRRLNPGVVYARVVGFGDHGPSRARPGYDIAAQAESGIMAINGDPASDPQRVGFSVVDAAAAYCLSQGILAALLKQARTGVCEDVVVSLLDVAIHLQGTVWNEYQQTDIVPERSGNGQPNAAPAADLVHVKDGDVVVSAYTDVHWERLCTLLGRADLVADPRFADNRVRVAHRLDLLDILSDAFRAMTRAEVVALLSGEGLVVGAVLDHSEVLASPDVVADHYFTSAVGETGERFTVPALPFRIGTQVVNGGMVPRVGQHAAEILAALGYTPEQVRDLVADGVVGSSGPTTKRPQPPT